MKVGDIEITPREILFSTLILSIMIGFGVLISRPILRSVTNDYIKISTATQVNDSNNFDYIRRTNVGDFLAEGTLTADQPVTIDISGLYAKVKRVYEEYREHTRIVTETYTDSKGRTQTRHRTETYWSWDEINSDEKSTSTFEFLGKHFTPYQINYHMDLSYHSTEDLGYNKRYVYYTSPRYVSGTILGNAIENSYKDMDFDKDLSIESKIKSAESKMKSAPIIFWIFWIILTIGLIIGFYALENKWLED